MKQVIEKGNTLLVDGPARVDLLSGEAEVFGATLKASTKTVIREGKRVAFGIKKKALFNIMLGEGASAEEVKGSTIPASWKEACNTILTFTEKPVVVMILGEVDSGKTSFCTYLANRALKEKYKVAIIDADLGQSDIGPPSTIGFCHLKQPIRDPFLLRAEKARFIGTTTPSGAITKVIDELCEMKEDCLRETVDFLVINTDGWVEGKDAVQYKLRLIKRIAPNILVGIQQQEELTPILADLHKVRVISIESPSAIKRRDREKRKILRELSYKKYLRGAKVQSFPLSWVKVEGIPFRANTFSNGKSLKKIKEKLGVNPVHCGETASSFVIVLGKNQRAKTERILSLEKELGKKIKLIREGAEKGLLVGLHDAQENFLGIGILNRIDYERRVLQIYTSVKTNVFSIHIGQVKLDRKGNEIGIYPIFKNCNLT